MNTPSAKSSRWTTFVIALVAIGFVAAGVGAFKSFFDQRLETRRLQEQGVETEAEIVSVEITTQRRGGRHARVGVTYTDRESGTTAVAEVLDCTEEQHEEGDRTVRIVYVPGNPEEVRRAECVSSADSVLGAVLGPIFLGLGLFLLLAPLRRNRRDPASLSCLVLQ